MGPRYKLGIDIGGTFTDLVLVDERDGKTVIGKERTTPDDPARGVVQGFTRLLEKAGVGAGEVEQIVHATTLFTNAIIERKGAKTGLITTRGFRDVLEIGREIKYDLYDIFQTKPAPLVPQHLRKEVTERIRVDGTVQVPLDMDEVRAAMEELVAAGVHSVAVCFLHSYLNTAHEAQAAEWIRENYPSVSVSASYEVVREIREYERTSTTVANAYVKPLADRYLSRLLGELRNRGSGAKFYMMLSNGGITGVETARAVPIRLLESGPAAGALAAAFYGGLTQEKKLLAFDMGGTTAKACLIENGQPLISYTFEAARERRFKKGSGLPIKTATIELIEIGAGGGSIARIDELGLLKVGPESAGADPGPICYGSGGTRPAVTDADLILGYLNPDYFLGGEMKLDVQAAREGISRHIAEPLGVDVETAAWGIYDVVNEAMAGAARVHIAERGSDPKQYTMLATGGAGPVHAFYVARKLGLRRLVCPPAAGVASTLGLLVAPPKVDLVTSYVGRLEELDWARVESIYSQMEDEAASVLADAGVERDQIRFKRSADMRYVGQGFEIVVPLPDGPLGEGSAEQLAEAFRTTYQEQYFRSIEGVSVEVLTWRLTAYGPRPSTAEFFAQEKADGARGGEPQGPGPEKGQRRAYFPEYGGFRDVTVYDRYRLRPGRRLAGPAIVEERESTVVIGPNAEFEVDPFGNLIVEMGD